jgi:2-C-methyl-D-erythritol 4-phosphate cytidylyltransferase
LPRDVGVVVVAAGRGARLGGETPKQYQPIGGVPMVLRAVRAFTTHPDVAQVALVLPLADAESPPPFLRGVAGAGLLVVAGGAERADSVAAGLRVLDAACTIVLVHDAARPFVERGVIDGVIAHARSGVGAVAAIRVMDTLKQAAAEDPTRIDRTVPRDNLWRAQTPQGFPRAVLERAHAAADARSATDDAALVERTGVAVRLVPDSPINMKVTTAEDLALAELLVGRVG